MSEHYLLGFVRDRFPPSIISNWPIHLTHNGTHGILWSDHPTTCFSTKEEFLNATIAFYQNLCFSKIVTIPIQTGISVQEENHLYKILNEYDKNLDDCFREISGAWEYFILLSEVGDEVMRPPTNENIRNGQEYLNLIRARESHQQHRIQKIQQLRSSLLEEMTPYVKKHWNFISSKEELPNELGLLIQDTYKDEFNKRMTHFIQNVSDSWSITCTGPWLPFHFIDFSLKPNDIFLRRSLSWNERRINND